MINNLKFIIRTHNEENHIGLAIQSIFDHYKTDCSIIIVDNHSTDNTINIIKLFPKRFHDIHILNISENDYTPGKSLNMGLNFIEEKWKLSQSQIQQYIGILSAHCVIKKFDKNLIDKYFENDNCQAVMGKQVPIYMGKRITPRYIWSNFQVDYAVKNPKEKTGVDEERYFFHNAFSFIKSTVRFNEDLSGKEDRYWAFNIVKNNQYFMLDPNLICHHHWTNKGSTWSMF